MARTVRDTNLETRTARLRLPIRTEPYWRGLEKGFALGYRRRGKGVRGSRDAGKPMADMPSTGSALRTICRTLTG